MWKLVIFKDKGGQWRWSIVAKNKKVVSDGAEGYATKANAKRAARRLFKAFATGSVELVCP